MALPGPGAAQATAAAAGAVARLGSRHSPAPPGHPILPAIRRVRTWISRRWARRTGAWLVGVLFWHAVDALLRLGRLLDLHRIEVTGDERLGVLVGSANDPQHEEEGHHRGHEIGEGDLPGAAVMLALVRAAAPDDDDFRMLRGHKRRSVGEPGEQLRPGAKRGHDLRGPASTMISAPPSSTKATAIGKSTIRSRKFASRCSGPRIGI